MFFKNYEFLIAWRYLKSKRKDGFISIITLLSFIGITLGVATLIVVMSVMNGFREEMLSKILGMNGHITVTSNFSSDNIQDYNKLKQTIIKDPELQNKITSVIPIIESQIMASFNDNSAGVMLRGIEFQDLQKIEPLVKGIDKKFNPFQFQEGEVLVGRILANKLGITVGDEITFASAKGNITAFGTMPRIASYKVGGVFNTGMSTYDTNYIYINLKDSQTFFSMQDEVNFIEVFLNNADTANNLLKLFEKILYPSYRAFSWQNQNSSFVSALNVEKNVMFLILTLIILVASFNIISSLVMLVKDKAHDIAVFKTIGVAKTGIMKIFLLSGSFIGISGTLGGFALGLVVSNNIEIVRQFFQRLTGTKLFPEEVYFLSSLPSKVDYVEVFWVVFISFIISLLATIYPSLKASKQDPINVLRYE